VVSMSALAKKEQKARFSCWLLEARVGLLLIVSVFENPPIPK
jgi:hypothetical protein